MPRRKRTRRHRKHNHRNHFGASNEPEPIQDDPMRTYTALESPSAYAAKITEEFGFTTQLRTPSPELGVIHPRSRSPFTVATSPGRKRRSVSRESHQGYSGPPSMFDLSENGRSFITDLRTCQSSTILETRTESSRTKFRSSSSMAKLHSPGLEKIPLKAETGTQTCEGVNDNLITETPRINQEELLDFDYEINLIRNSPLSEYGTPLKRMRMSDNLSPVFDLKDTAVRIQDLNNLQNEQTGCKALNCSRVLSGDNLKRLQNFNELILNTTQSVDYDNCEPPLESEDTQESEDAQIEAQDSNNDVSGEISFFTPQLYNGKSASTPIEKKEAPKASKTSKSASTMSEMTENRIEILGQETIGHKATKLASNRTVSASTQAPSRTFRNVGVQTSCNEIKFTPPSKIKACKEKSFTVTKRRSYKSLSPAIMYYKASPKRDLKVSPIRRVSLERSNSADTIATIETCARIITRIKKYHGKYSSKFPAKIMEICTWLGMTIKKGVTSLYKLYTRQKASESTQDLHCNMCNLYRAQISALTATMDELRSEVNHMKQDHKDNPEKLSALCSEVEQLRRKLIQYEGLETEIKEIKERLAAKPVAAPPPPPPPPPPLPLMVPINPLISNRSTKVASRKKSIDNARPIISLDDILKVKLKKIGERPSPLQRRATEPLVQSSMLRHVKLRSATTRPQTPSSGTSSLSTSPCSSLTRILTNVDANVRRVKRLQRVNAYSFDDCSRRSRRERENYFD